MCVILFIAIKRRGDGKGKIAYIKFYISSFILCATLKMYFDRNRNFTIFVNL